MPHQVEIYQLLFQWMPLHSMYKDSLQKDGAQIYVVQKMHTLGEHPNKQTSAQRNIKSKSLSWHC